MRIAGINSPNYQLYQTNKPQNTPSHGQTTVSDQSHLPQTADSGALSTNGIQQNPTFVSRQNKALMHPSLVSQTTRDVDISDERVGFFSRKDDVQAEGWSAYSSNGQSAVRPVLDNTSYKAQVAIAEYLQTQYIDERLRFEAALGVDDYA
jgi:hypothetical protein